MNSNNYLENLQKLGFSKDESKIYLELINIGLCTADSLGKRTGFIRQQIYTKIEPLIKAGYVFTQQKGKKKFYGASDPNIFINEYNEKKKLVEQMVPDLKSMIENNHFEQDQIQQYEGIKGVKLLLDKTLESENEILWISNYDSSLILFQTHIFGNYTQKRIAKKIKLKALVNRLPKENKEIWISDDKQCRELRINNMVSSIEAQIICQDDMVILMSGDISNPICVLIKNSIFSRSLISIFEYIYNQSKKM